MIVRMAKVEIVGPKELLMEVISLMQEVGRFQLEPDAGTFLERGEEAGVRPLALDEKTVTERVFYEDLAGKIDTLLSYLPQVTVRTSYLEPLTVVDAVAGVVDRHLASCGELHRKREGLAREKGELVRHSAFLGTLEPLLAGVEEKTGFDFIGVTVREPPLMERLVEAAYQLCIIDPEGDYQQFPNSVVLGSAIRTGQALPEVMTFIEKNQAALQQKPFSIFILCMTLVGCKLCFATN